MVTRLTRYSSLTWECHACEILPVKYLQEGIEFTGRLQLNVSNQKDLIEGLRLTVTPRCGGGSMPLGSNSFGMIGTIAGADVKAATWLFLKLPMPGGPRCSHPACREKRACANARIRSTTCCLYTIAWVGHWWALTSATIVDRKK